MTEIQSPQPAHEPEGAANYIVSIVMTKPIPAGTNTQNKLYGVEAVSPDEARGKAIALAQADYPEHQFHTACHWVLQASAVTHHAASSWMWTHKAKGGEYRMLGEALLQCDDALKDMARVVVYQGADGRIWVRAGDEWDNRFKRMPKLAASEVNVPVHHTGEA